MKKFKLSNIKLPLSFYNFTSYIGALVAITGLFMFIFLFVVSFFFAEGGAYLGLVMWIVIPSFIVLG
ncbi:MAG: hypothetical protein PF484_07800, partial [Bacteroidales bacterium]|nr:hypothetical protein [Bacteroidales bacterium]